MQERYHRSAGKPASPSTSVASVRLNLAEGNQSENPGTSIYWVKGQDAPASLVAGP